VWDATLMVSQAGPVIRFKRPDGVVDALLPETAEILRHVCPHEIGHAEVAKHFGAKVHGIALSQTVGGLEAAAIYETPLDISLEDWSTIKAAGPAGEVLVFGSYGPAGARVDREHLAGRGYPGDFDLLVHRAKAILLTRRARFDRLRRLLSRRVFESDEVLAMKPLRLDRIGAYVLDEKDLA
jgi:hypothetical protein